jgi:kynurenine 3-monooxygenase
MFMTNNIMLSVEMRHAVTTPAYLLRRAVDKLLFAISSPKPVTLNTLGPTLARVAFPSLKPSGWLPLYTMVTFRPDIGYAAAKKKVEQQTALMSTLGYWGAGLVCIASVTSAWMVCGQYIVRRP